MGGGDEERRLFEQALRELEGASRSKLARAKGGTGGAAGRRTGGARLDKRLASLEPDDVVDLHGLRRRQAERVVGAALAAAPAGAHLLVIHGRGDGVLARWLPQFLDRDSRVAEHVRAPRRLGADGARVIRLRRDGG